MTRSLSSLQVHQQGLLMEARAGMAMKIQATAAAPPNLFGKPTCFGFVLFYIVLIMP